MHPSSDGGEGGGLSQVVHGEDAVRFAVVLLGDAAEPEDTEHSGVFGKGVHQTRKAKNTGVKNINAPS